MINEINVGRGTGPKFFQFAATQQIDGTSYFTLHSCGHLDRCWIITGNCCVCRGKSWGDCPVYAVANP